MSTNSQSRVGSSSVSIAATDVTVALIRQWHVIVGGGCVAVLVAVGLVLALPRTYVASIDVVPKRERTQVNYDTRIRSVSADNSSATSSGQAPAGLGSVSPERRQALSQLVRNPDIEKQVHQQLGDALPPQLRSRGELLRLVQGRLSPRSEIISIMVEAGDAATAELVAVAWSTAYERQVNQLYASSPSSVPAVERELNNARKNYQDAENEVVRFTSTSTVGELSRQAEVKQQLLRELQASQQTAAGDLYKIEHRLDLLTSQARALQQQLESTQSSAGASNTALALTLLKAQAFAASMQLPPNLQLQVPASAVSSAATAPVSQQGGGDARASASTTTELSAALRGFQDWTLAGNVQIQVAPGSALTPVDQLRTDAAVTVKTLEEWRARVNDQIRNSQAGASSLTGMSGADFTSLVQQIEADLRDLQGRISQEAAVQRNLVLARDVAWETFRSLSNKAEESRVAAVMGAGNEVALASQSVIAIPKPRPWPFVVPLALIMGVAGSAVWVIWRYCWPGIDVVVEGMRKERTNGAYGAHAAGYPTAKTSNEGVVSEHGRVSSVAR
jgi:hypothetical protein